MASKVTIHIDRNNEFCEIIRLSAKLLKEYHTKIYNKLETYISKTIETYSLNCSDNTVVNGCIPYQNKTELKPPHNTKNKRRIPNIQNIANLNSYFDDSNLSDLEKKIIEDKKEMLDLMKCKESFINSFLQLWYNCFSDLKFHYRTGKFIYIVESSHRNFQKNTNFPDAWLMEIPEVISTICENMYLYKHLFDNSAYSTKFLNFICHKNYIFVDFVMKILLTGTFVINTDKPIFGIDLALLRNQTSIDSLMEYNQILDNVRVNINEELTKFAAKNNQYMHEIIETLYEEIKKEEQFTEKIHLKGGNLFKINLHNYVSEITSQRPSNFNEIFGSVPPLEYSDWDFAVKLLDDDKKEDKYYETLYKPYREKLYLVLNKWQRKQNDLLAKKYEEIFDEFDKIFNFCNVGLTIKKYQKLENSKTFYIKRGAPIPEYKDFNISDELNNIKDNPSHKGKLDEFRQITIQEENSMPWKITDIEVLEPSERLDGFDLIRINYKYNIEFKLSEKFCINFKCHSEIFDFSIDKIDSFKHKYKQEIDKENLYEKVNINNKEYNSYTLVWFIYDIIGIFLEKPTAKDKKRLDRLMISLWILKLKGKDVKVLLYKLFKGDTIINHIKNMINSSTINIDNTLKAKYKKWLDEL